MATIARATSSWTAKTSCSSRSYRSAQRWAPVAGLDELRRNAEAVAAAPDAPFQHVARAQFPTDLPNIDRLALVLEGGISRDHHQLGEPRQLGCNVLGNAVTEIVLLRVAAEIGEGQHCDGGSIKQR